MSKQTRVFLGNKAREIILRGVNAIFEPVKLSLGPAAGSALMYRTYARGPRIVDDGHTIAGVIESKDEAERLVAQAFREAALQTNQKVGDGTATTICIAGKLINDIFGKLKDTEFSLTKSIFNVNKLRKELLDLSKKVQEKIKEKAKKIESLEDLEKIAIISLNNEELGKIVAKIVWDVGIDGFIDVVEGYKGEIETEVIKGARFAAKPAAKVFLNNPKKFEMIVEDCKVFLTNYKIDNIAQMIETFGKLLETNKKIVILSPDFSNDALTACFQTMFAPQNDGTFQKTGNELWPVKVPSLTTEQFKDLAVYFGASFIDKTTGRKLENVSESDLGFTQKIIVKSEENKEDAIALGGKGTIEGKYTNEEVGEFRVSSPLQERIKELKNQINEERIESHKKLLERRIASLASAVGIIRVGASTSAESLPLKLKVEDAQYACLAALEEGYVKGGGLCLKEISEEMGQSVLSGALEFPYKQIQENNGELLEIDDNIIDSAKVVRMAVEYAISVAANLLTCKIIIPEIEEPMPSEGYFAIAKELKMQNIIQAKREGIMKENLFEMEQDWQKRYYEEEDK